VECIRPNAPEIVSVFGEVVDGERLARIVTSPNHVGKHGIKASAIPNGHLRNSGLSLTRLGHLDKSTFDEIANAISATLNGEAAGVICATSDDLRNFRDESDSAVLCVFDDATKATEKIPENQAHAIAIAGRTLSDEEIIEIKTELMESVFGELVSLDCLEH
jgi:hypothetical protein